MTPSACAVATGVAALAGVTSGRMIDAGPAASRTARNLMFSLFDLRGIGSSPLECPAIVTTPAGQEKSRLGMVFMRGAYRAWLSKACPRHALLQARSRTTGTHRESGSSTAR